MNNKILLVSLLIFSTFANAASEKQMINDSKLSIKRYASVLKHTLKREMNKGSAVNAISACHSGTDAINRQLTAQSGWKIARTSLKIRNPNNAPDAWEKQVLLNFEKSKSRGATVKQLQYSEIIKQGKHTVFRYMQAIPVSGNCLSCHGEKLTSSVQAKLKQLYPQDNATGYKVGDIRGAFSITRKISR
jgi:cytochrome c553